MSETIVSSTLDPLILDLVEWIAREPRSYEDVIDVWRTSCPRLTVWEDATDRGLVERQSTPDRGIRVVATDRGREALIRHGRWIRDAQLQPAGPRAAHPCVS